MKNLVLLLFVILSIPVTAQNLFTPGYIVITEGDTIRGLIFEGADAQMSRKIIFKSSDDTEIQKFPAAKLAGFGFESGREFERRILLPKPGKHEDTTYIFAKNIYRGETDVFVGRRFQKRHPDFFLDNNSNRASIQIYRSGSDEAFEMKDFLDLFYNNPASLNNPQGVKFRVRKLLKSIAEKNEIAAGNFPVWEYRENIEHSWDLIAGLPVDYRNEAFHFRGAIYYNRTRPERTSKFSILHGIIYHHWERKEISVPALYLGARFDTKWQMINFMPIGIKFQGNSGNFRPYGYIGAGAALLRETYISREDNLAGEKQIHYKVLPTITSGLGVRTRIGKYYLITELTPTVNNLFFNLGLSI